MRNLILIASRKSKNITIYKSAVIFFNPFESYITKAKSQIHKKYLF